MKTQPINAQSLGPICFLTTPDACDGFADHVGELRGGDGSYSQGSRRNYVGEVCGGNSPAEAKANGLLLSASFNAFDKAGRELGIDAATLAERIDLAALLNLARQAANIIADEYPHSDGRKFTGTRLQTMLDKICKP